MGLFKDFMDIVKDIGDAASVANFHKKQYTSLHARSLQGTLQFPHIISKNLDIDTAQMVCKASERQMATFVQISMSMSPTLYIEDGTSATDYIKQFHQNIEDVRPDRMGAAALQAIINEGYTTFLNEGMGVLIATTTLNDKTNEVVIENQRQLKNLLEGLNHSILNRPVDSFILNNQKGRKLLTEATPRSISDFEKAKLDQQTKDRQERSRQFDEKLERERERERQQRLDDIRQRNEREADRADRAEGRRQEREDKALSREIEVRKISANVAMQQRRMGQTIRKDMDVTLNRNMLQDNDAKKANELVSTLVHVRIQMLSREKKTFIGYQDFVLGIKATMHPVQSDEIVDNLLMAYRGNNEVFNFIRWTTGEIAFFKDFILNMSQAKQDVVQRSAGASPLWISIKRARALSRLYNKLHSSKSILPNATIVITKEEVDYMKEHHGVDFMNLSVVQKVMDILFLIDFVVVDTASQICHFKLEAAENWESVSFSGLEKENSRDERKFKEMLKALNR